MRRRLILALVVGGLGACGGRDTVEPPAELIDFEQALDIRQLWQRKVGRGSERLRLGLIPATDGTRIFAGARDGTAAAFAVADGEPLWSTKTDLKLAAGPGVGGGQVVFGTSDGNLVALDAETGEVRWQRLVGSEILAAPVVGGSVIVFRGTDGRLGAVSAADGSELWSVVQSMPVLTLRGSTAPLMVGGTVVAGFDNGRVAAYNVQDGLTRWERALGTASGRSEIERLVDVGVDLAVFGSAVYAASFQGRAAAFDLTTGVELWPTIDLSSFVGIGVDAERVYVTNDVGAVVALNRQNGMEVWRQDDLRLRDVTAATRVRETVVVADYDGYLHWLSAADGSFMARARAASSQISAQPLALGSVVYVQSEDGTITAFEIVDEPA